MFTLAFHEFQIPFFGQLFQFLQDLFDMLFANFFVPQGFQIIAVDDISNQQGCFSQEFCLMLCYCLLPDERVLVRVGFDLCPIDKSFFLCDLAKGMQKMGHLRQQLLSAGAEMFCSKPGDGGMIRHLSAFQKIHVVDITPAVLFDRSGRSLDPFVIGIDHELEHDIRRRVVFCGHSFVCSVQSSQIHFLHELTDESHTII